MKASLCTPSLKFHSSSNYMRSTSRGLAAFELIDNDYHYHKGFYNYLIPLSMKIILTMNDRIQDRQKKHASRGHTFIILLGNEAGSAARLNAWAKMHAALSTRVRQQLAGT
ncbi:hypothetical protein [Paenibacillus abyssi]|nr:hypothetical protein [Paenibacillus abyssi]